MCSLIFGSVYYHPLFLEERPSIICFFRAESLLTTADSMLFLQALSLFSTTWFILDDLKHLFLLRSLFLTYPQAMESDVNLKPKLKRKANLSSGLAAQSFGPLKHRLIR